MKTKLGKYLVLEGSFEDKLHYFDEKIRELNRLAKEADDTVFKNSYKNLADAFHKQRNTLADSLLNRRRK